jgi:hypothetical protein
MVRPALYAGRTTTSFLPKIIKFHFVLKYKN